MTSCGMPVPPSADDFTRSPEHPPRKRKVPRQVTPSYLMNAAVYYLQRFASSRANLRRVLERKCLRSIAHHGGDMDTCRTWIAEVCDTLERQGFLNDRSFAEARARSMAAQGKASRAIRMTLAQKGVDREMVDAALERLAEDSGHPEDANPDLVAAVTYARKRRLGPWRLDAGLRAEKREKDLAALARQGFSPDVAFKVVDADDPVALEDEAGVV